VAAGAPASSLQIAAEPAMAVTTSLR